MRLGTSIYLHLIDQHYDLDQYLEKCRESKITIIFTTLINIKKDNETVLKRFIKLTTKAKELGMEVYGDVDGHFYDEFNLDKDDRDQAMDFFVNRLGLHGIRFDFGIGGEGVAKLSRNQKHVKVILNGSDPSSELEQIISLNANKNNLISCWNFYPQRYTASALEYFINRMAYVKNNGVLFEAFVALQRNDVQGPWSHNDKLPSIEIHRDLTLDFQLRHMLALGVDDIIISTQFINDEEFDVIKKVDVNKITLKINCFEKLSVIEKEILNNHLIHSVRKDLADYIIRSTAPRIKYKGEKIEVRNDKRAFFEKGDVVILNDNAQNYAGELQIVLKEMPNDGIRNFVGRLDQNEQKIVDCLKPNSEFIFVQS